MIWFFYLSEAVDGVSPLSFVYSGYFEGKERGGGVTVQSLSMDLTSPCFFTAFLCDWHFSSTLSSWGATPSVRKGYWLRQQNYSNRYTIEPYWTLLRMFSCIHAALLLWTLITLNPLWLRSQSASLSHRARCSVVRFDGELSILPTNSPPIPIQPSHFHSMKSISSYGMLTSRLLSSSCAQ